MGLFFFLFNGGFCNALSVVSGVSGEAHRHACASGVRVVHVVVREKGEGKESVMRAVIEIPSFNASLFDPPRKHENSS